eukprot:TRINITY_DN3432_c0_g1_i1.p2 TRINITY_DN3432_c0_g1~~TRINITY_DN3432_c0_g1_i1.p2  ORF type:complete len:237 (+),score=73.18 TRINITY_DN3432_c0_g1_i1:119-829(+)
MKADSTDTAIQNLWKLCGMDTEAGRIMYRYYGSHCKPQIKYPKVKTKTPQQLADEKKLQETAKKSCPQKAKISYPVPKPKVARSVAAIDYVPKRKAQNVIQKELEEAKRKPLARPHPGQNRAAMIDKLQEDNQFSIGILPKSVQSTPMTFDNSRTHNKSKKPNMKPVERRSKTEAEELDDLFESIAREIEERQEHLDAILRCGKNEDVEQRIKGEIACRFSELQKVAELKKKLQQS